MRLGRSDAIWDLAVTPGELWAVSDGNALTRVSLEEGPITAS